MRELIPPHKRTVELTFEIFICQKRPLLCLLFAYHHFIMRLARRTSKQREPGEGEQAVDVQNVRFSVCSICVMQLK